VKRVTGSELTVEPFIHYLRERHSELWE